MSSFEALEEQQDEAETLIELAEEESDTDLIEEALEILNQPAEQEAEAQQMLSEEADESSAVLEITLGPVERMRPIGRPCSSECTAMGGSHGLQDWVLTSNS